jgi:type I restriction enzyme M protein
MSSNTSGEGDIRRELIEKDMVDCMIALPGQLFYTTQIPVCLWFVCKNKGQRPHPENPALHYRDRRGETLFIDARQIGTMIDRTQKELTKEDIAQIAGTYHAWRNEVPLPPSIPLKGEEGSDGTVIASAARQSVPYEDVAGYCKSASLSEIQSNDFVLTPGRYVGVADEEDDGIHFEDKMTDLTATLKTQMAQAEQLDIDIRANLKVLGYE